MPNSRITLIAMMGAALMLVHQVAGKAVRDSFFLSNYPASDLPKVVIAAAAISVVFVLIFARLMGRFGPSLMVPAGFFLSSLLHLTEYFFVPDSPKLWSVVIYFHIVALGAILLSGFWSLMAESFDPRAAKQVFGRITAVGTLGGIVSGTLVATLFSTASVLLLLVAFHLGCSIVLMSLRSVPSPAPARPAPAQSDKTVAPATLFRRAPYLGMIALVVLAGTSSAIILDYLFKAGASDAMGKDKLLPFFAAFYTATQIITFLAQTFLVRRVLEKIGIGRTISMLPLGVGAGALGALIAPIFQVFTIVRSLEFVLRGSLYRSAYELLYTPVPAAEKRAAKTLIDVAFDRAGDALGSGIVQLFLWLGTSFIASGLLGVALALAVAGVWISLSLDATYSGLLEKRLVDKAVEIDADDVRDSTTRSVIIRRPGAAAAGAPANLSIAQPRTADATLEAIRELRSGDSRRTLAAVQGITRPTPLIAAQLVRLLAWDEVSDAVREVLQRDPDPIAGLLVDHLKNQDDVQFGIRRRIPKILGHCDSRIAVHGLLAGLTDNRFEVRFQCSRALDALVLRRPDLKVPAEEVFAAVERELRVAHPIWNSRRLIDQRHGTDPNAFLDEILRERADQSLEHVFSLFATVLPREPVKIAFRVLHTDNKMLRGLAAEYLDSILPAHIRELLWAMVEPGLVKQSKGRESGQDALNKLLQSHESLMLMIDKKPPEPQT